MAVDSSEGYTWATEPHTADDPIIEEDARFYAKISLLKNFSYIDLLYLSTLIYRHVFGKA